MALLTAKEILTADDLEHEIVPVPEWGGDVMVRGMTGAERDKFESSLRDEKKGGEALNLTNVRAKLASLTICDESGKRLFKEADVQALSQKSAAALQRVFAVAQRLSGIQDTDVDDMVDEIETDPTDALPSD